MVYRVNNRGFATGDRVRLGSGETGRIKQYVTRNGIGGYRVEIMDGPRKGDVVGASPAGMVKLGARNKVAVSLGGTSYVCRVARTAHEHARGLQGTATLAPDEGLLFVFEPPRATTFHMGSVSYPIDIVFIDPADRVAKVVHNAQPGTRERWSVPYCGAVLEVAGGGASQIQPGSTVRVAAPPIADSTRYEISFPSEDLDGDTLPEDRYKERGTPDDASPDADGGSPKYWEQNYGYDPVKWPDGDGPGLRPTAATINDPADYIVGLIEAMARQERPLDWHRDVLNPSLAYAVVEPRDISDWLGSYDITSSAGLTDLFEVATSRDGLNVLGDGLVLAGVADIAHVAAGPDNQDVLVLWTEHEDFTNGPEQNT